MNLYEVCFDFPWESIDYILKLSELNKEDFEKELAKINSDRKNVQIYLNRDLGSISEEEIDTLKKFELIGNDPYNLYIQMWE